MSQTIMSETPTEKITEVFVDETGNSPPVELDQNEFPFTVSYWSSESVADKIQVTKTPLDDPSGLVWFPVVGYQSLNGPPYLIEPFTAIRVSGGIEGASMTVTQYKNRDEIPVQLGVFPI